jgi:Cu(I)/Ag(I) efflux system membrane fusion protein
MTPKDFVPRTPASRLAILAILGSGAIGFGVARLTDHPAIIPVTGAAAPAAKDKPLYWYDPMAPTQHFDKPGKSPFMDMQLVPKYADGAASGEGGATAGVGIDPALSQTLGMRTVSVRRGTLRSSLTAAGTIDFNQRDVAIVQARSAGFVQRVYARAPGDVLRAGAPLADILVPEWGGAQAEYLAVRRTGNAALTHAAQQRLALLGMPSGMITSVEQSGRLHTIVTVTTPTSGVIKTLGVRAGMTLTAGETLAEVDGLGTVWLNAAVPEAAAGSLKLGQSALATLEAFPGESFAGRVSAILPDVQADSRTLTIRIELPNRGGRLRPGMFANVSFGGDTRSALLVPSEALIRTGKRTLVMLALGNGRYQPAEVQIGREAGDDTEILAGLDEGETIVASGQFLIDSEASLAGVAARPIGASSAAALAPAKPSPALYETTGTIEELKPDSVTLSHEPVPTIKWPAMTMSFALPDAQIARRLKVGDRVRFGFDHPNDGPTIHRMTKVAGQ